MMPRPAVPAARMCPRRSGVVISSGITLHDLHGFSASLRLRYFGPRDLTSDGIVSIQRNAFC